MKYRSSWATFLSGCLLVLIPSMATAMTNADEANPPPRLERYFYSDIATVEALASAGADIVSRERGHIDVLLPVGAQREALPAKVHQALAAFPRSIVLHEDARATIDASIREDANLGRYHTLAEVKTALDAAVATHPTICQLHVLGKSIEGRDLVALRISSAPEEANKPAFLFTGLHHAREWISVEVPMGLIEKLTTGYGSDAAITQLVDEREIWIIPVVNPDGLHHSQTEYQMWRKNRRSNGDGSIGVDPNRNYGYKWGGVGAGDYGSSETFRGATAFSEPDTQAVRDLAIAQKLVTALSFHSYSELILWPWGYSREAPPDAEVIVKHGQKMAEFNGYRPQQSIDLYPTTGDFDDYMYGELGILAYTIELGQEFIPPESEVDEIVAKNLKCCLYLLENAAQPFPMFRVGPLSTTTRGEGPYTVKATLDVRRWPDYQPGRVVLKHRSGDQTDYAEVEMTRVDPQAADFTGDIPGAGYTKHHYFVEVSTSEGAVTRYPSEGDLSFDVVEKLVLLVADDGGQNYQRFYEPALSSAGITYMLWKTAGQGSPPASLTQEASMVIWFTGSQYSDTLSADEQASLSTYVNQGGKVLILGQDIGYDIKNTAFYRDVLKAKFATDTAGSTQVKGETGGLLDGLTLEIGPGGDGVPQRYPDALEVVEGGNAVAKYGSGQVAAIGHAGAGRVLYFGFGLEGIQTPESRATVMGRCVEWLQSSDEAALRILADLEAGKPARFEALVASHGADAEARAVARVLYRRLVAAGRRELAERLSESAPREP